MPEVDVPKNIEEIFRQARRAARGELRPAGKESGAYLVLVTPGRMILFQPCPPRGSMSETQVAMIGKIISPKIKRNIAVIAYTELKAVKSDLNKAIPFIGMLMGLAYIGHAVWLFEGHASALAAGCRDADVLFVVGEMVTHLQDDWAQIAASTMRHQEIYIYDCKTFALRKYNFSQAA
jgi:hypothetical protein